MAVAVFIFYLLLFCLLVARINFFTKSGLGWPMLTGLFICKIVAGIFYARFYALPQYIAGSDTWRFFELSKAETDTLFTNPGAFFMDIFHYGYNSSGGIFSGQNSYWNDLKSNVIIKLLAVCNVFTFKNYYADVIFFNFLFLFGPVAFYRVMQQVFAGKKWLLVITVFLLPSFLFWCSGIHKDGLIFSCLALLIFHVYSQMCAAKVNWPWLVLCAVWFLGLFAMRNVICMLLVPALAACGLCYKYPLAKKWVIAAVYLLCLLLFFVSPIINGNINLPQYAISKQNEFKQLQGGSQINVPDLKPNFISFVMFLPTALDIALLRPHMSEIKNASYIPAIAELFLIWFFAGLFIFSTKAPLSGAAQGAIVVFCFCFAISYLLLSGYTVTFSGAVVRYKAIILPLVLCPLACMVNFNTKTQKV